MRILLDTCSILWTILEPNRLSVAAKNFLESQSATVFVSPMSCAEIAHLVEKQRIRLDRHWKVWFRHHLAINEWEVQPVDLAIIEEAYSLPPPIHGDPTDRVLVATSRLHRMVLVTADRKILDYPHVNAKW